MGQPVPSALLAPERVAIVGLSDDPAKHGRRVLGHLRRLGFGGTVHGVNPRLPQVDGVEVVGRLSDLGEPPEVVVCAVPGPAVPGVIEEAGRCGATAAVVFAGGFAEAGPVGRGAQSALEAAAREGAVAVLGPNSGGVIRPSAGLALTFLTCLDRPAEEIRSGPVGLVTQSGGTGSYLHNLAAERGGGLAVSISTGNEAGIGAAEALEALAALDDVHAIALVLETVRDGPAFLRAIRAAREAGKPVVACRLGRSERGRRLMTTHTGALAGPAHVLDGVLDHAGVTIAETPGEMLEVAEVLARVPQPSGERVGVVTHSGGIAILASDLAERDIVHLPAPGPALVKRLVPLLDHGAADNPLDMGGIIGGPHRYAEVVDAFATSGDYDVVLAVSSAHPPAHTDARVESLLDLVPDAPVVHLWMAGDLGASGLTRLRAAGRPVAEEPRAAMRALAGLIRLAAIESSPPDLEVPPAPALPIAERSGRLSEHRAKELMAGWGVPVVAGGQAMTADDAVAIAESLGYPVAVKANLPELAHKTEAGAVRLGLDDAVAVAGAFHAVVEAAQAAVGPDTVRAVRVERMQPGLEMIVGAVHDPAFGPVSLVGMGGVHAEALDDVAIAPAPVSEAGARRMIDRLRSRAMLDAHRSGPAPDVAALAAIVSTVSAAFFAHRFELAEVEINPLAWTGTGWEALDALVRLRDAAAG